MRRSRSPKKVSVRPAVTAASPNTRARYRLPCPVVALPLALPADCWAPGAERGPGARGRGGGEAPPVGAKLGDDDLRVSPADPGDLIQPLDRRPKRGDLGLDLAVQLGDVGAGRGDARQR